MKVHSRLTFNLVTLFAILALMLAGAHQPARAATITVCASGCTYSTIAAAIAGASAGDTINIQAGTYHEHDLSVDKNLVLQGTGSSVVTVDAQHLGRVFSVAPYVTDATISGMTITNGQVTDANSGGIENRGVLTMDDVIITGNANIKSSNDYLFGGGIYNMKTLTMTNSQVTHNSSVYNGAGVYAYFGTTTHLTNVLIQDNTMTGSNGAGAGIAVNSDISASASTLTLDNVTVDNNTGGNIGAGIWTQDYATITIYNSTISNNSDTALGYTAMYVSPNSTLSMTNVTISGNEAGTQAHSGLTISNDTTANLNNVTIANNLASQGAGLLTYGTVNVRNSIIANNIVTGSYPDCEGTINSLDYNLIENVNGCTINGTTTHNVTGTDPMLSILGDNGGATETMALQSGSPAIDAGDNTTCAPSDQRGYPRPQDGNSDTTSICDIGAYEVMPTTTTITSDSPDPSTPGANVTVSISVTSPGGTPQGTVHVITSSGDDICDIILVTGNGNCILTLATLGAQTLTANYTSTSPHLDSSDTESHDVWNMMTFKSQKVNDGWIRESTETSGTGGSKSTVGLLMVGDDAGDRQYRSILSFDTSALPTGVTIMKAIVYVRRSTVTGTNPVSTHGAFYADIRKTYFGAGLSLALNDFNAMANKPAIATFGVTPVNSWYSAPFLSAGFPYINLGGTTQLRLRFAKDDNDDKGADVLNLFGADATNASYKPYIVVYYVP